MILNNPIVISLNDDIDINIEYGELTYHISVAKLIDLMYKSGYAYITVDKPKQIQ